jgi:hypothetical protein
MAVSGAIDWFFDNEEMGIILEDDCLPSQSFFWFCEELLIKYKANKNIFLISGDGRASREIDIENDYDFIRYSLIWGWASWRRAWEKYDVTMASWSENNSKIINNISDEPLTQRYWKNAFQNTYDNKIDTWDYQFSYVLQKSGGLGIVPKVNLITNIGFGVDSTHTSNENDDNANIPRFDIEFPITHPSKIKINKQITQFYDEKIFTEISFFTRVINKLSRIFLKRNIIK